MGEKMDLNDATDLLCHIQAKLSFLQVVLGGALYPNEPSELTLNEDEQAGVYWIFQDLEEDMSLVKKALDEDAEKKREALPDLPDCLKRQAAQGTGQK